MYLVLMYDTYVHITLLALVSPKRLVLSVPKASTYPQQRTDPILSEHVYVLTCVYQSCIPARHAAASYQARATYTR